MVKAIAIIPARGGSTRMPKKNILDFAGKPMIAHTIEAALNSNRFSRVLVSTDSQEIAEISLKYGAEVPFLRSSCADNHTPVSEAVLYALNQAEEYYNEKFDIVAQLMANCPIRNAEDIKLAYDNFVKKDFDSQISCFKFGFSNPWWALKINKNGEGTPLLNISINTRSQDLEELYCPTGAIWFAKTNNLRTHKTFYANHRYFEIDWKSAVDIDNYEDLDMAKAIYYMLHKDNDVKR